MKQLLQAGFYRYFKSKPFWVGLVLMIVFAGLVCATGIVYSEYPIAVDVVLFSALPMMGIVCVVLIGLVSGTEHSDGTIRNKMIAGHSRSQVYLADWIVGMVASVVLLLAYMAVILSVGSFIFEKNQTQLSKLLYLFLCSALITCVFASISTLLTMNCRSKTLSLVFGMVLMIGLYLLAILLESRLAEPEWVQPFVLTAEGLEEGEWIQNRFYIGGAARDFCQMIYNLNPSGAAMQLSQLNLDYSNTWGYLAALLTLALSGFGVLLFRKKELK